MHRTQPQAERPGAAAPPTPGVLVLAPRPARRMGEPAARRTASQATELAHDARNLISALDLYCELLSAPGVLAPGFGHYAEDLRRVAGGGAKLIEALAAPGQQGFSRYPGAERRLEFGPAEPPRQPFPGIDDLGAELLGLEGLLQSLAGPGVRVEVECAPCAGRLALKADDLLRILFNLVANAVEALAALPPEFRRAPTVRITAQRGGGASFLDRRAGAGGATRAAETVVLSVRDNGPGIAPEDLPHIFRAGFSTRRGAAGRDSGGGGPEQQDEAAARGLGLSIVARLVSSAGGAVRVVSPSRLGARFDIELPVLGPAPAGRRLDFDGPLPPAKINNLQQISAQIEKEA